MKDLLQKAQTLFLLVAGWTLMACSGDDGQGSGSTLTDYIKVEGEIIFGAKETSKTIFIDANCHWTIDLQDAWQGLSVVGSPEGDGSREVTITTPVNQTVNTRGASMIISSRGGFRKFVRVRQLAGDANLSVSPTELNIPVTGGSASFTITTNTTWNITGSTSGFTYDKTSGTGTSQVTVTAEANPYEDSRKLTLVVTVGNDAPVEVNIIQSGKSSTFEVSPSNFEGVTAVGVELAVSVTSDVTWTVRSNTNWASVPNWNAQMTSGTVLVKVEANHSAQSRTAELVFTASNKEQTQRTVTIQQQGSIVPTIATPTAQERTRNTATIVGTLTSDFPLTSCKLVYCSKDKGDPRTASGAQSVAFTPTANGSQYSFSQQLTGLSDGTSYNLRVTATNAIGTGYSEILEFTTTGRTPDSGDNPQPEW